MRTQNSIKENVSSYEQTDKVLNDCVCVFVSMSLCVCVCVCV